MSEKNAGRYYSEPLDLRFFLILKFVPEEDQMLIKIILSEKVEDIIIDFKVFYALHNNP